MHSADNVICSLYEGDYHLGVAVLINSLVAGGFHGLCWIGYRDRVPEWAFVLQKLDGGNAFRVTEKVSLVFEKIETAHHLTNYKPEFMLSLMRRNIVRQRLCYFDPDIISQASWNFYERWLGFGVALCEETVNGTMPTNHPLRLSWIKSMKASGWEGPRRELSRYYNGGFVGVTSQTAKFLELWSNILNMAGGAGLNLGVFMTGSREHPFYASDQDALNIAAMYCEETLSTIGPEGMGFRGGGFTMHHATSSTKPWRKRFIMEAFQGKPPLAVDRRFLQLASGPLYPFSATSLRLRKWQAIIALAIGRVYRRL